MDNIFKKLPLYRLQEVIGEQRIEQVQNVLEALSYDNINASLVNSRGFLASYALSTLNISYLLSGDGIKESIAYLSKDESNDLLSKLNINILDDLNECCEKIARLVTKNPYRKIFIEFMGMGDFMSFDSEIITPPSEYSFEIAPSPYKPLKDYQFEVYFQSLDKLKNRDSRFIVQMPTGSGKTRTAMEIVCDFLNQNPESSVIWLAHSTELCDQAVECFREVWPHLAKRDLTLHKHYGAHKVKVDSPKIGFLCASFQSLLPLVEKSSSLLDNTLGAKRLIVVDEAHKVVAPTYKKVTKALINDAAAVMGLTATPGRSYGNSNPEMEKENKELSDFFFNTNITFNPQGQSSIEYLRDKGVLAKAKFELLTISANDITLTAKDLEYIDKTFELPGEVLKKLGKSTIRNAEIVDKLVKLVEENRAKSIIFFATSLEQSKLVSSILNFLNVKAGHIDGATPSLLRKEIITKFKNQRLSVLCNYEVLSTGFDAPLVDCVFIARPTASVVLYSQIIGRGLRGPAIGGTEKTLIVNVKDNINNLPGIDEMFEIFADYWTE